MEVFLFRSAAGTTVRQTLAGTGCYEMRVEPSRREPPYCSVPFRSIFLIENVLRYETSDHWISPRRIWRLGG